jgi:putative PIN family toxin of toxin-antitoxin system
MPNILRRVFVDANILIRGVTFPRFPYEILRLAARQEISLVVSSSVLDDARRYVGELFPEFLPHLESFLSVANIEIVAEPTRQEIETHSNLVRDVEDIPVILAAINAKVDFFVSTDADFTDEDASTEKLRALFVPGRVMKPGTFLSEVIGWDHTALEKISRRRWDELERVW